MLQCFCSVIDHSWLKNVVMKKKTDGTRGAAKSLMFLPHLNVFCDLYLYTFRQCGIFCFIWKQSKMCNNITNSCWYACLFSLPVCKITYWNWKEKLQVHHFWTFNGYRNAIKMLNLFRPPGADFLSTIQGDIPFSSIPCCSLGIVHKHTASPSLHSP